MFKKLSLLFFLFSFIGFGSYSININQKLKPVNSPILRDSIIDLKENNPIALVGDLQRTTIWELMIGREQNDSEREKIIKDIASKNPAALILLGDMVSNGSDLKEWKYFQNLLKPVELENIPIIPVLGNHEYWGDNIIALNNAEQVFPVFQKSHWYCKIYGDVVFVILDSNRKDIGENEWANEREWFENILKYYNSAQTVKGIVVCFHHPPYTNSIVTGDNTDVQEAFVQPFLNSPKTLAMICGHAHTYERFQEKGKMFIVSGGGGGPRVLLKTGLNVHKDLINLPSLRPFNYLLIYLKSGGIEITARGLKKGESQFFTIDNFSISFNNYSY